jgi:uncharacterized membrane protein YfcA
MALLGVAPAAMRPTALTLNLFVAGIATWQYLRAGCFSKRVFWPCAMASVPAAFLGGLLPLTGTTYKILVGVALACAAMRLFWHAPADNTRQQRTPPVLLAASIGAGIGLLSGMIGIGGGIFLSPIVIVLHWATPRETAGVSALFILVNSVAGLAAQSAALMALPPAWPLWAAAALAGGWLGAASGCYHFSAMTIKRVLAGILVLAALKMVLV